MKEIKMENLYANLTFISGEICKLDTTTAKKKLTLKHDLHTNTNLYKFYVFILITSLMH